MSDDEIAALKARIDQLERANKPPAPLDLKDWTPPPNPIDRLQMPASVLREMARAVPDHVVKDIVSRGTIPGPSGAGASGTITRVSSNPGIPGSNTGWAREIPIGPPPGIRMVDALCIADDVRQRIKR
jgi:hypothetical protein